MVVALVTLKCKGGEILGARGASFACVPWGCSCGFLRVGHWAGTETVLLTLGDTAGVESPGVGSDDQMMLSLAPLEVSVGQYWVRVLVD